MTQPYSVLCHEISACLSQKNGDDDILAWKNAFTLLNLCERNPPVPSPVVSLPKASNA